MSYQRLLLPGALGVVALVASCANLLGIEDADCDPTFDGDCALRGAGGTANGTAQVSPGLQPGTGGSAGASGFGVAAAGAGGSTAPAAAAGAGGVGGSSSVASAQGSAGAPAAMAGAAGGATMPDDDPVVQRASSLCLEYCDTVAEACTGMNQQYASLQACLLVCEILQAGTPGATSGNNIECRLGRARLAATTGEGANYCYTAGPGGGGVCGDDCEGYCTLMTEKCRELGTYQQCTASCSIVPDLSLPPTVQFYNTSIQSGDSLQCRLFHVTASTLDPVGHCTHAAGNSPCQ